MALCSTKMSILPCIDYWDQFSATRLGIGRRSTMVRVSPRNARSTPSRQSLILAVLLASTLAFCTQFGHREWLFAIEAQTTSSVVDDDNDQCRFYLAESAIPQSGLGVFTAVDLKKGDEAQSLPDIWYVLGRIAPCMHSSPHVLLASMSLTRRMARPLTRTRGRGTFSMLVTKESDHGPPAKALRRSSTPCPITLKPRNSCPCAPNPMRA